MERELRARLKSDTEIASLAGGRVFWDVRPEQSAFPSVVITTIVSERPQTHDGFLGFTRSLIQLACYATGKTAAVTLREAVVNAVVPAKYIDQIEFLRGQDVETRSRSRNTNSGVVYQEIVEVTLYHT